MSRELIEALRAAAAFDATPLPEDLATLHVPFDDLLGDETTERELRKAAEASGRIALVGATLQIAHTALSEAARAEADRVGLALIESSIAAWEPET